MNSIASDKPSSSIAAQTSSQSPFSIEGPCNNYITVLHGVNQIFNNELGNIRSKWKDIQKTDELTSKISDRVDDIANNAEAIANRLKYVQGELKRQVEATSELEDVVVAMRHEINDVTIEDGWKECQKEYLQQQESNERDRVAQLRAERESLERQANFLRAKYRCAIADLGEADDRLRHIQLINEELENETTTELMKWKELLRSSREENVKWERDDLDICEEVNYILPLEGDLKILKSDVADVRERVELMQRRRRVERMEFKRIKQTCVEAAKRTKELKLLVAEKNAQNQAKLPRTIEDIQVDLFLDEEERSIEQKFVDIHTHESEEDGQQSSEFFQQQEWNYCSEKISTTILNLDDKQSPNVSNDGQQDVREEQRSNMNSQTSLVNKIAEIFKRP
ncbi:hypothetical protein SNE40_005632 [Patella caerulea]|uniref:Uncharacterized protein n=1 Tax=Patella caerulea TaxID=87958 RepID=A0AAN8K8B6_PATCE